MSTPLAQRPLVGVPAGVSAYAIDLTAAGGWIAVVGEKGRSALLGSDGLRSPLPRPARFPLVAALPAGGAVVIDRRAERGVTNATVVGPEGGITAEFHAGDDVRGVVALADGIAIAYGDEGIAQQTGPAREGIAYFDLSGAQVLGYGSRFKRVRIAEVYGVTRLGEQRVAALCYPGFELLILDVRAATESVHASPKKVHGAHALAACGDQLCFYARTLDRIDVWTPGAKTVESIKTSRVESARGTVGGRFITVNRGEYSVTTVGGVP